MPGNSEHTLHVTYYIIVSDAVKKQDPGRQPHGSLFLYHVCRGEEVSLALDKVWDITFLKIPK